MIALWRVARIFTDSGDGKIVVKLYNANIVTIFRDVKGEHSSFIGGKAEDPLHPLHDHPFALGLL